MRGFNEKVKTREGFFQDDWAIKHFLDKKRRENCVIWKKAKIRETLSAFHRSSPRLFWIFISHPFFCFPNFPFRAKSRKKLSKGFMFREETREGFLIFIIFHSRAVGRKAKRRNFNEGDFMFSIVFRIIFLLFRSSKDGCVSFYNRNKF